MRNSFLFRISGFYGSDPHYDRRGCWPSDLSAILAPSFCLVCVFMKWFMNLVLMTIFQHLNCFKLIECFNLVIMKIFMKETTNYFSACWTNYHKCIRNGKRIHFLPLSFSIFLFLSHSVILSFTSLSFKISLYFLSCLHHALSLFILHLRSISLFPSFSSLSSYSSLYILLFLCFSVLIFSVSVFLIVYHCLHLFHSLNFSASRTIPLYSPSLSLSHISFSPLTIARSLSFSLSFSLILKIFQ